MTEKYWNHKIELLRKSAVIAALVQKHDFTVVVVLARTQ